MMGDRNPTNLAEHGEVTMHRPVLLLVTAVVAGACLAPRAPAAAADRPNVLFIFSDDHAAQALSCYGSNRNQTPHLDRIAKEGMLFENCFCTNGICGPSRAVIQTGKHSHLNGFLTNGDKFDGSQQTFPKLLQKAGYQTAVIGKWHLGEHQAPQGFDYSEVLIGQGPYYNPPMLRDANGSGDNAKRERVKHTGYTTDIIADLSLEWLKNGRDKTKPFMLMCQHKAPHRNWEPSPQHLTMYDDVIIPEPATLFDDYSGRGKAAHQQDMSIAKTMTPFDLKLVPPRNFTEEQLQKWNAAYGPKNEAFRKLELEGDELVKWKYQRYIKDYLRCIASVDDNVGRVLDYLDEAGLADDTVVIYTSDQGFYLGEHGWFDKRFIYEESLRMPLMVRWPGVVSPGQRNTDLVQNLDFAETFLEVAGVEVPADMQGRSLVSTLNGETPKDWRDAIYYHYYEYPGAHSVKRHYGLRTDRYTLTHFYYDIDEWELYDLKEDPLQLKSVYDDPAYADVQAKLQARLAELQEQYDVPEAHTEPPANPPQRRNRQPRKKDAA
jgi:arylsulfatase A-like enzyme